MEEDFAKKVSGTKNLLLSSMSNRLIAALTAVALILVSKLCMPEVYNGVKAAFSDSYPAKTSVQEAFSFVADKVKTTEVFSRITKNEPENKLLIKENTPIQNLSQNAYGKNYCRPVSGGILKSFGAYTDENGVRQNSPGIDIGVPLGSSVAAFCGGTVYELSENETYGKYMVIDHGGGMRTLYAHLLCTFVPLNAAVDTGQRIALSGRDNDTALLHFEITLDGTHLDPLQYIDVW